jgi:hypothetical protein
MLLNDTLKLIFYCSSFSPISSAVQVNRSCLKIKKILVNKIIFNCTNNTCVYTMLHFSTLQDNADERVVEAGRNYRDPADRNEVRDLSRLHMISLSW